MFNKINKKVILLFIIVSLMLLASPLVFANQTSDDGGMLDYDVVSDDNSVYDDVSNSYDNSISKEDVDIKKDGYNSIYVSPEGSGSGYSQSDTTSLECAIGDLNDNGTIYLTCDDDGNSMYDLYNVGINPNVLKNTTRNVNIVGDTSSNVSLKSDLLMFDIGEVNLTFRNVNFVNSYSYYYLGVIISQVSNVSFVNCSFINFNGSYGGVSFIYSVYSNMTFTNCTFRDSSFSNSSSFLKTYVRRVMGEYINNKPIQYYSYANIRFVNNLFVNNTANSNSNLLFFDCADCVELIDNCFKNNTAPNGLVRSYLSFNDSFVNNTFVDNYANCLYLDNSVGLVRSNNFINNSGRMATGALIYSGKYNLTNNTFVNNHVDTYGGAIVNLGYYTVNITESVFDNNSAVYGGAIYNIHDTLNITYSNFTNNHARFGGALCYLLNDTKAEDYMYNPQLNEANTITNCLFESNSADEGSVLYDRNSNVRFNENSVCSGDVSDNLVTVMENASINLDNNWWGLNNPNFAVVTGGVIPESWIVMDLVNTTTQTNLVKLEVTLNTLNNGKGFSGDIPERLVKFTSNSGSFDVDQAVINNSLANTYYGTGRVYASIDNEKLELNHKKEVWLSVNNVKTSANKNITIKVDTVNDLTKNLTVSIDNKVIKNVKVNATLSIDYFVDGSYERGNYTIKVSYPGDSKYSAKNMTSTLEVVNDEKSTINNVITPLTTIKTNDTSSLPRKYDPRLTNSTTPLTNQGNSGSCWVFSSINTLQECIKKQTNKTYDFSENNAKNVIAKYSLIGDNEKTPNVGGSGIEMISYMTGWYGPVLEAMEEYADYSVISPIYDSSYHVQDVIFIPERKNITDIKQIKEAIYKYGAVQIVYCAGSIDTSIYNDKYYEDNHGATLVGWDDDYDKNNFKNEYGNESIIPEANGAFILKNSWGGGFADDGYQYLSYYDPTYGGFNDTNYYNIELYSFLVNNTPEYTNIYQYDALSTQKITFVGKAVMKNIYTADKEETLAAVGTYFIDKSSYKLKIYINDELVHTQTSNITERGYRTITLDKYYLLNKNDEFTIELEIESLERNNTEIYYQYKQSHNDGYHENLSYIIYDGEHWIDCYNYLDKGAITLKAYTLETPVINTTTKLENKTMTITTTTRNNDREANITYILNGKPLKDSKNKLVNILVNNDTTQTTSLDVGNITEYTLKTIYTSSQYKIEETNTFTRNNTTISIETNNTKPKINEEVLITVQLKDNTTNLEDQSINLTVDNHKYTLITDANGEANISITLEKTGNQTIVAQYNGNNIYNPSNNTLTINVTKIPAQIDANVKNNSIINTTIEVSLRDYADNTLANKTLNIYDNNEKLIATQTTDSTGKAVIKLNLTNGNHEISIKYSGDDVYNATETTINVDVAKLSSSVNLTTPTTAYIGDVITITVMVKDQNAKLATGNVTIKVDNKVVKTLTLTKGKANITTTINTTGTHNITATYNGNINTSTATTTKTVQVNKKDTKLTASTNTNMVGNTTINVTLTDNNNKAVSKASVVITDKNNKQLTTTTTDANGKSNVKVNLPTGIQTINIKYAGNGTYKPSNITLNVNVVKLNSTITLNATTPVYVGDNNVITVTVKDQNNKSVSGNVTIQLDDTTIKTLSLKDGKANTTTTINTSGTHSITVVYNGNANTTNTTATKTVKANKINTKLNGSTLSSRVDNITINLTLTSNRNKTLNNAQITVYDSSDIEIATATTDKNGRATVKLNIPSGKQVVTIRYDGNGTYNPSNKTMTINVAKLNATMTMNATTPVTINESIILNITVKDQNKKAVTGNVTIKVDNDTLKTMIVTNGEVNTNIKIDTAGTHTITAVYNGDQNTNTRTATKSVKVNRINTTITITANNTAARVNDNVNVTVRLRSANKKFIDNESITLKINNKNYTLVTDANGTASTTYTLGKNFNEINITAKYDGNEVYNHTTQNLTINRIYKADMELLTGSFNAKPGDVVKLIAHIGDNGVDLDGGQLVFKINNMTLKDENNTVVKINVTKGLAILEYKIPDTLSASTHKLTAVYATRLYGRVELSTPMTINRYETHINVNPIIVKDNNIVIKAQVVDQNNQALNKITPMCIKINGKSYNFNTTTGTVDYNVTQTLKDGYYNVTIISGANGKYLGSTVKTVIIKTNESINTNYKNNTINNQTSKNSGTTKTSSIMSILTGASTVKPGDTIKLIAHLSEDQIDINGGQLVFKLNGMTMRDEKGNPIIINTKNGLAILEYKIPDNLGARTHNLTAVYSSKKYGRVELTAPLTMNRLNTHINVDPIYTSSDNTYIKAEILDDNNNKINKKTAVVIKIDGVSFNMTNTNGEIFFKVPVKLSQGVHQITIISGDNGKYVDSRANTVLIRT